MTPLESFRTLWNNAVEREASDDFTGSSYTAVPPPIKELFEQFVDEGATKEDIVHLCIMLSNEDSHDWDTIAHYFL